MITLIIAWGQAPTYKLTEGEELSKEEICEDGDLKTYSFNTQEEANAFIYGVNESDGWNEYLFVEKVGDKYKEE